jgi:cell division protease FtsH
VRDLFKQAKEARPAIVFIDELDAIGRSRSGNVAGISGGNDEREQTLNQILTEMDGFQPGENVIVLGATNRPEVLDSALLRPGRFDRRIAVNPPDLKGRIQILKIHTRSVPLDDSVDLERVASSIPGSTGADIALLVNEAALFAARRDHAKVEQSDFTDAIEKILLGAERQVVMTDADRKRTAYHESGHALVGMLTPGADPVRKISIIPRGQALGVTLSTPDSDRYNYARDELLAQIKVALGGRAAERVVFDELSTGAESDIQNLTQVARGMVGRWGMSEAVGPIAVTDGRQNGPLLPGVAPASEPTQELVDQEVRRIVEESERAVIDLLEEHREQLDALANALLDRETLDQPEAYEVAGVTPAKVEPAEEAKAAGTPGWAPISRSADRDLESDVPLRVVLPHPVDAVLLPESLDDVGDPGLVLDRLRAGAKLGAVGRQSDLWVLHRVSVPVAVRPGDRKEQEPLALLHEPDRTGALATGLAPGDGQLDLVAVLKRVPEVFSGHRSQPIASNIAVQISSQRRHSSPQIRQCS